MWRNMIPVYSGTVSRFEKEFQFRINEPFRTFLINHNNGTPALGAFPTANRERRLSQLLDFSGCTASNNAWEINKRLRDKIGNKRIVVAKEFSGNLICLERNYRQQYIVVWSHISGEFERSLLDIPVFVNVLA